MDEHVAQYNAQAMLALPDLIALARLVVGMPCVNAYEQAEGGFRVQALAADLVRLRRAARGALNRAGIDWTKIEKRAPASPEKVG